MMREFKKLRSSGVTLVELVISIVIISIAMVAVLSSFATSMTYSADPVWRNKSLKLAQLYLDEILSKNYDDATPLGGVPPVTSPSCASLGPDGETSRADYNDVDDYNGTDDQPPVVLAGSVDGSYADYRVQVSVSCDGSAVAATGGTPDNHAKKITILITPPNQATMTFASYKGNF